MTPGSKPVTVVSIDEPFWRMAACEPSGAVGGLKFERLAVIPPPSESFHAEPVRSPPPAPFACRKPCGGCTGFSKPPSGMAGTALERLTESMSREASPIWSCALISMLAEGP